MAAGTVEQQPLDDSDCCGKRKDEGEARDGGSCHNVLFLGTLEKGRGCIEFVFDSKEWYFSRELRLLAAMGEGWLCYRLPGQNQAKQWELRPAILY